MQLLHHILKQQHNHSGHVQLWVGQVAIKQATQQYHDICFELLEHFQMLVFVPGPVQELQEECKSGHNLHNSAAVGFGQGPLTAGLLSGCLPGKAWQRSDTGH